MPRKSVESSSRRAKGEGSICYRKDKNLWSISLTVGYDQQGKQKRKLIYARTREELIQKKKDFEASQVGGFVEPAKITVGQFIESWLNDAYKSSVRLSTYIRNEGIIRNHVVPAIGRLPLSKLAPLNLQSLYAKKLSEGQSPRSVRNMHFVLHKAFGQAAQWGYIPRNVADMVSLPKPQKQEMKVLTPEQANKLLSEGKRDWYYPLYALALTTGLRQGELLGLQWDDINMENGTVTVRRTLKELNGQLISGEPKSKNARRTISLPDRAIRILREHRKAQLERGLIGSKCVFTNHNGGPIRPQNLVRRSFYPLLKSLDLPLVRFHDLRHTHATMLLQENVNPKLVQERLGHSNISLTLDTYSHVLPNMQKQVAEKLDGIFGA